MGEVDAPSPFRVRGRTPPEILIIGCLRKSPRRGERAHGQAAEYLPGDRLRLRRAVDDVGERRIVVAGKGQRAGSHRRWRDMCGIEGYGAERRPRRLVERAADNVVT